MTKYLIALDLDGTVANFTKKANEVLGKEFAECDNTIAWEVLSLNCPDLYKDLELLPDAPLLIDFLKEHFSGSFYALTAIPSRAIFPQVTAHKRDWVGENIGPIRTEFGPYSIDKQYHCQGGHHVLIDDNPLCIEQWTAKGGIGILHKDAVSTISRLSEICLK